MNFGNHRNAFDRVNNKRIDKHNYFLDDIDDEDNIYYDVLIQNNTDEEIVATYNETSKKVLVDNPKDYYLTIVKFSIPSTDIPIFAYPPNPVPPGQPDRRFKVTTRFGATQETVVVPFIPAGVGTSNTVFTYQSFIEMINQAIRTSLINLWASAGPLPVPDPNIASNPVPIMIFTDENTPLYIRFPQEYNEDIVPGTVKMFMNYNLFTFFQNFQHFFYSYTADDGYEIRVTDTGNNFESITSGPYTGDYYNMHQDSATFYLWWDIRDVIVTTSIPINAEIIGNVGSGGNYNTIPILTDVSTSFFGQPYQQRSDILYIPQPQYRLITLLDHGQLSQIDFKFFYRTKNLELRPLLLAPQTNLSMKILFTKKKNNIN